jgi:pimeloyl-ACP methyl ester carboxylesterase
MAKPRQECPMSQSPSLAGAEIAARAVDSATRIADQARHVASVALRAAPVFAPRPPTLPPLSPFLKSPLALAQDAAAYAIDAGQRWVMFWDAMRQAGNAFVAHEEAGCPPVLVFDYDMVVDGRTLPRPCNYALVAIRPPEGWAPLNGALRPFVIIDPRAGHGAGIGGFKSDSQVGVALRRGHPVYFVIFFRDPEPGQSILDITAAEGEFLRAIRARHPEAPKPVVIGNCQGGWAVMMLGATEPELTGPLVLNGAPLSYWAGETGKNPMRYMGGLAGGAWPAAMLADLGHGKFDGANLVLNFESLSPGNTWFRKYFNLYENADTETERFLEFERWWGGFYLMNGDEISWIVENLFIGNRFSHGTLGAGPGAAFDMRAVRSPVIVFASAGDNITPPGQALRWIADVYHDEQEIKTRGQTIIYLVHTDIGHLGIFVSGKVALKEHAEIANTLEMIEAVAPGLYEMRITGTEGTGLNTGFQVELVERSIADIRTISGDAENEAFPAVAKVSELSESLYDMTLRPLIRQFATEQSAELRRKLHPLRARRSLLSEKVNPFMAPFAAWAETARARRAPADPGNAFIALERAMADGIERGIDRWRDMRDASAEIAFHALYGGLAAAGITDDATPIEVPAQAALLQTPEVQAAVGRVAEGGYAAAVVRMMILLARARGGVRRDRLARSNTLLTSESPFAEMSAEARQTLIREQTLIVAVVPEEALAALPVLLARAPERRRALAAVEGVAGPESELNEGALAMLRRLREALKLPRPAAA